MAHHVSFRVDDDLRERMESEARADGRSRSGWIRWVLNQELRRREIERSLYDGIPTRQIKAEIAR